VQSDQLLVLQLQNYKVTKLYIHSVDKEMHLKALKMKFCFYNFPWSSEKYVLIENCDLLGHYAENSGNLLQTFRDNLSAS